MKASLAGMLLEPMALLVLSGGLADPCLVRVRKMALMLVVPKDASPFHPFGLLFSSDDLVTF